MTPPEPSGLTLELARTLPASRRQVFAAFTDADELARWWGPAGFTIPSLDFEPRMGAAYRIEMRPPEGDSFHLRGEFRELDPPERLAYSFEWDPPDPDDVETEVRLSFNERGDSTEVELAHGPFKTEERLALHRDGWGDSLDKLEQRMSSKRVPEQ